MKKKILLLLIIFSFLTTAAYLAYTYLLPSPGVLEIKTNPETVVFLNHQKEGTTPFKKQLPPQTVTLTLFNPENTTSPLLEKTLRIHPTTLTFVRYDFSAGKDKASGEILNLSRIRSKDQSSLKVISYPHHATVILDGQVKGYTPLLLEKTAPGQHTLEIALAHYQPYILEINLSPHYRLNCQIDLAPEEEASSSPQPLPTPSISQVKILSTPTGWLRVRKGPGTKFSIIGKVYPGKEYPLLEKKDGWFKIRFQIQGEEEQEGWITEKYAQEINLTPTPEVGD